MAQPVDTIDREWLEQVATLTLEFGRLLMASGASARRVDETTACIAVGLGIERVALRVGYASLVITVANGDNTLTQMCRIGPLGVNQNLYHALCRAAVQIGDRRLTVAEARAELNLIVRESPRHNDLVVAVAVGVACAAFGRLIGVDWVGVGPIFVAASLGQFVRRQLALRNVNGFISAAVVAFAGSSLCGFGARLIGSQTVLADMIATVLLLVPGVPAFNAQYDILEGRPSLGSARAVWVMVMLVFTAVGVWLAQGLLGEGR